MLQRRKGQPGYLCACKDGRGKIPGLLQYYNRGSTGTGSVYPEGISGSDYGSTKNQYVEIDPAKEVSTYEKSAVLLFRTEGKRRTRPLCGYWRQMAGKQKQEKQRISGSSGPERT